ncbi:MAG: 1-deoxy-D-xylulose-5-phosphate synthase [Gammaproteobacteria bacterium]|nr:1-deoxy-D-xylulose-5-phosphate synthase [Gammaproteobacteria bacterium]MYD76717.1 1-deoxy-D-xylulose-5-phosphate synthase [Gammaproteobacteria bacterium]MYJ51621.1 1-deoxy-D-xylulose-5-phosphate synthase [Gammaproteobacteria bacterium]
MTTDVDKFPLLSQIKDPASVRELHPDELEHLADEIRNYLVDVTSKIGGHFAAGLGTVELSIALHFVFNTPEDRIVWDIGHQAYPHKILTGRRNLLHSIRQHGGISGFLKRTESEYDTFGAGHSSTSISAALGMAVGMKQLGLSRETIAVIGDGALTGGMAYEALNNAGNEDTDLIVVLNDNEMSISPNVGAVSYYLSRILSGRAYTMARGGARTVLGTLPPSVLRYAERAEGLIKGMVMPSTFFEEMGFYYIGPVDGHDVGALVSTLQNLKDVRGPRFLHIVTRKGKGYAPAEEDPLVYHGVTPFDPETGEFPPKKKVRTYTHVFGDWLCDMAEADPKLIGITPAMREGSGLVKFSERFPDRYFDVGIAEQHSLTFAAGLACEGVKPVLAIYSTFLQRAYDQLIHDVSIQDLDILLAIDRAGFVGADGPTHAGVYDLSYMRCVPNMLIMVPADEAECRNMLYTGYLHQGPASVRYPRGSGPGVSETKKMQALAIGKAEIRRESATGKVAIMAFGTMVAQAESISEHLDATVANMRFVKPLDEETIVSLADRHRYLVTIEENVVMGGAGSAINEFLSAQGICVSILNIGVPDRHVEHGTQREQWNEVGLDEEGLLNQINSFIESENGKQNDSR